MIIKGEIIGENVKYVNGNMLTIEQKTALEQTQKKEKISINYVSLRNPLSRSQSADTFAELGTPR